LECEVVRRKPRRPFVADLGMGNAQVLGKVPRQAGNHDLPAGQLRSCVLDEAASPIRVGADEDERDQHERQDQQDADRPRQYLDRPWHQRVG
jgi:hypothetical protein